MKDRKPGRWHSALVIVPTYNESDNIPTLIAQLLAAHPDVDVLVVDDNSPDGTGFLVDRIADETARVHVLHRPAKLGLGSAYRDGFEYALGNGYGYVLTMDADFSHPPDRIPEMLSKVLGCDVVIGSRYVAGSRVIDSPLIRRLISRMANLLATFMLGLRAADCTAGFRCYRASVLRDIDFHQVRSNGYAFLFEMLYRCQRAGFKIEEIPITFRDRRLGRSKISRWEILAALATLARLGRYRLLRKDESVYRQQHQ